MNDEPEAVGENGLIGQEDGDLVRAGIGQSNRNVSLYVVSMPRGLKPERLLLLLQDNAIAWIGNCNVLVPYAETGRPSVQDYERRRHDLGPNAVDRVEGSYDHGGAVGQLLDLITEDRVLKARFDAVLGSSW